MTKRQNPAAAGTGRSPRGAGRRSAAAPEEAGNPPARQYVVSAECLISSAGELKSALSALLATPGEVQLDVGALQRIDTAGLQLLCAFVRERNSQGRSTTWLGTTEVLGTAARLLGLSAELATGQQEPA
jgi:ABC-type transporter Mla MlaB component